MEQFEQLLTCCVCLDRYRIPKLLPCQHSFCMEPCMEGLVDYVRRQVKCPECRAEHRIPYNGVQAFPTNVTLQRFLELHIEITGELPDPTSGQIMERCNVCSEKAYLQPCAHCEKKICEDCKSAHMDILRREITRFNSQIRRSLHRLQDALTIIEKNMTTLETNCSSTVEEIDEIYRRVTKAIKDRSDQLKGEIERYLSGELRNLNTLKENLDAEIQNINSNCDIVDKYMNDTVDWDDCELMDTKEIFLKTVEFLRHFEYENSDYTRRVRFVVSMDPNQLVMNLSTFGDLNIATSHLTGGSTSGSHLAPSLQQGLMRSKSDHRLTSQYRQQDERLGYNDEPVLGGRKFGERPVRINTDRDRYSDIATNRYNRGEYDYDNDYDNDSQSSRTPKSRFRSRFVRGHQNDDSDNEQQISQRQDQEKRKDKVRDGEDASRGQLSGIIRLSDCSRVIQRLADIGKEKKKDKKADNSADKAAVQAAIQAQKAAMQKARAAQQAAALQKQKSEDDELNRAKRQSKNIDSNVSSPTTSSSTSGNTSAATSSNIDIDRPATDRVSTLKRNALSSGNSEESDNSSHLVSTVRKTPTHSESKAIAAPMPSQVTSVKKPTRSGSSDSNASTESSVSSTQIAARGMSVSHYSTNRESPVRVRPTTGNTITGTKTAISAKTNTSSVGDKKPFVSRFLPQHSSVASTNKSHAESSSSSEEETSTEEESEDEADNTLKKTTAATITTKPLSTTSVGSGSSGGGNSNTKASSTGTSYRERLEARRASRDDTNSRLTSSYQTLATTPSSTASASSSNVGYSSGTTSSSALRQRPVTASHHESDDRYERGTAGSRLLLNYNVPYTSRRPYRTVKYRKRLV